MIAGADGSLWASKQGYNFWGIAIFFVPTLFPVAVWLNSSFLQQLHLLGVIGRWAYMVVLFPAVCQGIKTIRSLFVLILFGSWWRIGGHKKCPFLWWERFCGCEGHMLLGVRQGIKNERKLNVFSHTHPLPLRPSLVYCERCWSGPIFFSFTSCKSILKIDYLCSLKEGCHVGYCICLILTHKCLASCLSHSCSRYCFAHGLSAPLNREIWMDLVLPYYLVALGNPHTFSFRFQEY